MNSRVLYAGILMALSSAAQANTVTSDACAAGARDFSVTATTVTACLAAGIGNINGNNDAFQLANPGWVFIDASDNNNGTHDGWLSGAPSLTSGLNGTFSINPLAYSTYDRIAIGFKSGEGRFDPDWAVFELADNTLSGSWSISGSQALSHALLYGIGSPTSVPEPGTLALIGLAACAVAAGERRRRPAA